MKHTDIENKMKTKEAKSNCCNAPVFTDVDDEGSDCLVCAECFRPCSTYAKKSKSMQPTLGKLSKNNLIHKEGFKAGYKKGRKEALDEELEEAETKADIAIKNYQQGYIDAKKGRKQAPHDTRAGFCCACGYDLSVMEDKIKKAYKKGKEKERKRIVDILECKGLVSWEELFEL